MLGSSNYVCIKAWSSYMGVLCGPGDRDVKSLPVVASCSRWATWAMAITELVWSHSNSVCWLFHLIPQTLLPRSSVFSQKFPLKTAHPSLHFGQFANDSIWRPLKWRLHFCSASTMTLMSLNAGFLLHSSHSCTTSLHPASASMRTRAFHIILIFLTTQRAHHSILDWRLSLSRSCPEVCRIFTSSSMSLESG